jgi:hypothetical protein
MVNDRGPNGSRPVSFHLVSMDCIPVVEICILAISRRNAWTFHAHNETGFENGARPAAYQPGNRLLTRL